jgi:hypothetical protein
VRPKASAFLRHLPDFGPLRKAVLDRAANVRGMVVGPPQAVGWLARGPEGWTIRTGSAPSGPGALLVATPGDDGHGAWKKIGMIDQGRPRVANPDDTALAEGRPVFVIPEVARGS